MQNNIYVGVDIGGTSIKAGVLVNNKLMKTFQAKTQANLSQEEILNILYKTIDKVWLENVTAIGIGVPGYLDVEKGEVLLINNIPSFKGLTLKKVVSERYNVPVLVNNDANCFALGETYFGAGKEFSNVVGITLGTGLGGGVIVNRKLQSGLYGGAGELGCLPYKDSNFEDYCSSKLFANKYQSTGFELFEKAQAGDQSAKEAFAELGKHLGELITSIIYMLAPDAIIIGGSIAKSFKLFAPGIQNKLDVFPVELIRNRIEVRQAELDNGGIFGAAALCLSELKEMPELND